MGSVAVVEIGHQANEGGQGLGEGDVSFSGYRAKDAHNE
jgi:hypothetical protein